MLSHKHDNRKFECYMCPFEDKRYYKLRIHFKERHRLTERKPFKCSECNRWLATKKTYQDHMLQHTGERQYGCHLCDRTYLFQSQLNTHLVKKHVPKSHQCTICTLNFDQAFDLELNLHIVHTQRFRCTLCNESFTQHDKHKHIRWCSIKRSLYFQSNLIHFNRHTSQTKVITRIFITTVTFTSAMPDKYFFSDVSTHNAW